MANIDWASCTTWPAYSEREDTKCYDQHNTVAAMCIHSVRFIFKDCDSTSGITNSRHTYGTIPIRLKMNIYSFKKIDGLPAKFLGHNV